MSADTCGCGQAHVLAMFRRADYDEYAMPVDVVAFRSCKELTEFLEDVPPDVQETHCAEFMSSRVKHHAAWIKKYGRKQQAREQAERFMKSTRPLVWCDNPDHGEVHRRNENCVNPTSSKSDSE